MWKRLKKEFPEESSNRKYTGRTIGAPKKSGNWVKNVKTVSTYPPDGTFGRDKTPQQIADTMASHTVSPKGLGSAIKMVQYFINRYGKSRMDPEWLGRLNEAKRILQDKLRARKAAGK
jgi:D-alanine-D-alanine ligase-like ATP-grasp enzyme